MDTLLLYLVAAICLLGSYLKNREKTGIAMKKAVKAFENILPQFLVVFLLVAMGMAVLDPETISLVLGKNSGVFGVLAASLIGAITLIPGFVAFPAAAALLHGGAGATQIAAFVSSLMMVGVVTLPLEIQFFGKRAAFLRNLLAYGFSLIAACLRRLGGKRMKPAACVVMRRLRCHRRLHRLFLLLLPLYRDKAVEIISFQAKTLLLVIPPIFVLLGLLDVWVPREQMMRFMGPGSGLKGGTAGLSPRVVCRRPALCRLSGGRHPDEKRGGLHQHPDLHRRLVDDQDPDAAVRKLGPWRALCPLPTGHRYCRHRPHRSGAQGHAVTRRDSPALCPGGKDRLV